MVFLEDLIHKASEFYCLKQQLDMLLRHCIERIKYLILMIRKCHIENIDNIFLELFQIQRTLSTMKYKYSFEFEDFLDNFIYFFDRQDEYNKIYLYNHFQKNTEFPS